MALLLWLTLSCGHKPESKLTIATAANMQFAMTELTDFFSEKTGIACETILGSSGKLTAQISAGAPYHLFVSADMKYPQTLFEAGLTESAPAVYAAGRLILWSTSSTHLSFPQSLSDQNVTHIALANPQTAPYGKAAMETLQKLGLEESLLPKLVYGESIAQTNQFITSGAAEIGFTAKSVVLSSNLAGKGKWVDIPADYHNPLTQGVVLLKGMADHKSEARQFYEFLFSAEAKEILNKFGYTTAQ
jgi:molybdate transport system substrate-binding protein